MPKPYTSEWIELQVDRELSRWLQQWCLCFQRFATFCLDLANHPPNRVVTHCMLLIVQPRSWEDDPAKKYQVMDASVARFSDLLADNPRLDGLAHIDPIDLTRLRFVVIMQNYAGETRRLRIIQWFDLSLDRYRNMNKAASAALGGPESEWDSTLINSVWSSDPREIEKKFEPKESD